MNTITYTVIDYLELIGYKIGDGSPFHWKCFGDSAFYYNFTNFNGLSYNFEFNAVFDTKTKEIYELTFANKNYTFVWISPLHKEAYFTEMGEFYPDNDETYVEDIVYLFDLVKQNLNN